MNTKHIEIETYKLCNLAECYAVTNDQNGTSRNYVLFDRNNNINTNIGRALQYNLILL